MPHRDHLERLKAAADPEQVAAWLGLQGRGKRYFCPACQPDGGKTPDLVVREKGFICHKCGLKGDILQLIMVYGNLDFMGAVEALEQLTGLQGAGMPGGYDGKGRTANTRPGATRTPRQAAAVTPAEPPDPAVYEAFLNACRPVEGRVLDWIAQELAAAPGDIEDLVARLGLRFCGREYLDVTKQLREHFGDAALQTAGLLKRSKAELWELVPSFWHFYLSRAGFLVIPYLQDGRPVYLKVRPPVSKQDAQRRRLVRFMNTAGAIPCLYNVDALKPPPDRVLICEGESDTWAALLAGWAAVGSPGARSFKAAWVEDFRGLQDKEGRSRVYLVPDADAAGAEGTRIIADLFAAAGLPVPLQVTIPPGQGKDLREFLKGEKTE